MGRLTLLARLDCEAQPVQHLERQGGQSRQRQGVKRRPVQYRLLFLRRVGEVDFLEHEVSLVPLWAEPAAAGPAAAGPAAGPRRFDEDLEPGRVDQARCY